VRKFQKSLNLTDNQTEQLRSLLAERQQELQRFRSEGKGKRRKADLKTAREKFKSDVRGILTPEQAQIFDQRFSGKK
jgi:Spy/CpxP family protein refolding chaperone